MAILKNQKHEKFAQGIAHGLDATKAYAAAGFKPHRQAASRLLTVVDVGLRVEELKKLIAERAVDALVITKELILRRIQEIADKALEDGQYTPALNATVKLGEEACGMFVKKSESTVNLKVAPEEMTDADLAAIVAGKASAPDAATH